MQIIINQKEIEKAIKLYLSSNVMVRNLSDVKIEFITTRSGEGVKATIDIMDEGVVPSSSLVRDPSPSLVYDVDRPKSMYDNGENENNEDGVPLTSSEPEAKCMTEEAEQQFKRESMFAGLKKVK